MKTEQIQQEIERTRDEMTGTLHAIEHKLSARQLLDQAVDTMRDFTSDQSRLGSAVRDNPIPLAIIGLGIGWLALSETIGRQAEVKASTAAPGWSGETAEYSPARDAPTGEGLGPIIAEGEAMTAQARQKLQQAADVTRRQVSAWSQSAVDMASDAGERARDIYTEHPLTMGVAAAALGAALGMMLPRTRTEAEMLGGRMQDVVRQARDTGSEIVERAGRVARTAMRAARHEAEPSAEIPAKPAPHSTAIIH
jgi:ElaB/YqjD/DUF883 family membrane-anchored ribosome-binding protein